MLNTEEFIKRLVELDYSHLCVVPCSFAKYLINAAINSPHIEYTPCASEAVACSVAAGLKISGKSPIVIVQSSGVTNMGSCITSLLKPYEIKFPILSSWRTYNVGDSEIQHMHLATELPSLIRSYGYNSLELDNENLSNCINQVQHSNSSHTICMIKKGSFTPVELEAKHRLDLSLYNPRSMYLKRLNSEFKNSEYIFIGTTGNTAREMFTFMSQTKNFYMAGNMGGAVSLGLGAAIAGKKVVVCGGDAEFVMHMGGLTTAGRYKDEIDLTYILFDNESNKSTGGQNTYQSHVNYIEIARNSGFDVHEDIITGVDEFSTGFIKQNSGLRMVWVKCDIDPETPRPPLEEVKVNSL